MTSPITLLRHKSCTEQCPEDCKANDWVVQGEDEEFPDDDISVKCGTLEF